MTMIFLFRHGETDWNQQQRFQGHVDIPLNNTGREQARNLIPILERHSIEAILSSDLSRTLETAQIIANSLKIPVFQDPGIREAHLGGAQGMTYQEIEEKFGSDLILRWRSSRITDADISYPGGETGNAVLQRTFDALQKFIHSTAHSRIGVATHGGVIRRVMHKLLPPDSPPVPIPNGVVYEIRYDRIERRFSLQ
jgi:probable phosphoglycerate mutase